MASILRVNTLTDASSNNSTAMSTINQGTAKAWLNLDGTGTISARDSFNNASVTDNGTGDYTSTITNAMNNDDYLGIVEADVSSVADFAIGCTDDNSTVRTTTVLRAAVGNTSGQRKDTDTVGISIHGDLA